MAILHNVYQNLHISFVCNSGIHSSSQHYLSQIDDTPRSWKWQGNTIYVTQLQGKHQCVFTLFRLPTVHVVVYAFLNWCYENFYEIFPCLWQYEILFLVNPVFLKWISPLYKVAGNYLDHISWKIVTKIPDCAIPFVIVIILGSGVPEELS